MVVLTIMEYEGPTSVHGPQHRGDKLVNPKTLLDERYQRGNLAFVIGGSSETVENEFLERFNLVLKRHEIHDRLVSARGLVTSFRIMHSTVYGDSPLVGIIDILERNVFFVFKQPVKLGVVSMESELGKQEGGVGLYEWSIAFDTVPDSSTARLDPSCLVVGFFDCLPCQ